MISTYLDVQSRFNELRGRRRVGGRMKRLQRVNDELLEQCHVLEHENHSLQVANGLLVVRDDDREQKLEEFNTLVQNHESQIVTLQTSNATSVRDYQQLVVMYQ